MSENDNKLHDYNLNDNHDGGRGGRGSRRGGRGGRGRGTCGHSKYCYMGPTFEANWEESIDDFDEMNLKSDLFCGILGCAGYRRPTPVQSLAIKPILLGRNVIVQAQPCIGKKKRYHNWNSSKIKYRGANNTSSCYYTRKRNCKMYIQHL